MIQAVTGLPTTLIRGFGNLYPWVWKRESMPPMGNMILRASLFHGKPLVGLLLNLLETPCVRALPEWKCAGIAVVEADVALTLAGFRVWVKNSMKASSLSPLAKLNSERWQGNGLESIHQPEPGEQNPNTWGSYCRSMPTKPMVMNWHQFPPFREEVWKDSIAAGEKSTSQFPWIMSRTC